MNILQIKDDVLGLLQCGSDLGEPAFQELGDLPAEAWEWADKVQEMQREVRAHRLSGRILEAVNLEEKLERDVMRRGWGTRFL
jgi:geranylgeranyl pyrophosphate synthase